MRQGNTIQQSIKKLKIHTVKELKDVEINFKAEGLTAILGPNGSGKSTILHLLACAYNPISNKRRDYRFPDFFLPVSFREGDTFSWEGTKFTYVYETHAEGRDTTSELSIHKTSKYWVPGKKSYKSVRRNRWLSYLGIETCVPDIEKEKLRSHIDYLSLADPENNILNDAKYILGKDYSEYQICTRRDKRKNKRVQVGTTQYSSLSMGAGEQRVFTILEEVHKAEAYGLILIDELDLLLHQASLARLLEKLSYKARNKHLQIIFTAHNQSILKCPDIDFLHIHHSGEKSFCLSANDPRAIEQLTGEVHKAMQIYVEDELSKAIVLQICSEEGCRKLVSVYTFGAIENAFTLVAASGLMPDEFQNRRTLFVLDGDRYTTPDERLLQLQRHLTGQSQDRDDLRQSLLSRIMQFCIPPGQSPERYYHSLITAPDTEDPTISPNAQSLRKEVVAFNPVGAEHHRLLSTPIANLEMTTDVGYTYIAELLSKSAQWNEITTDVRKWIQEQVQELS